jgi:hypothetical protein
VKVIPSNQTLILAGEHGAQGGRSGTVGHAFVDASGAAILPSGGAVLKRVTMVTEFPDSTRVYVRADYASHRDAAPDNVVAIQPRSISPRTQDAISGASKDVYGNPQTLSRQAGLSAHLRPEEQYAQTQRILADTRPTVHLDVHA